MAGSLKWFIYSTDNGTDFAIELDESNTESINAGTNDYLDGSTTIFSIPRNLKPREAFYESVDGTRVIRCIPLTQTIYNGLLVDQRSILDPIGGTDQLQLKRIRPEVIRLPYPDDTGIIDGDIT